MLNRSLVIAFFALLVTSDLVLAEKFLLKGKGNATALVKNEKLNLAVKTGDLADYSTRRKFDLSIGGHKIKIEPIIAGELVVFQFRLKDTDIPTTVSDPTTFIIEDGKFIALGLGSSGPIKRSFKFEKLKGVYKIDIELTGDVPSGFTLSCDEADLYIDSKSNEADKNNVSTATMRWIIGGSVLALAAVIAFSIVVGFLIRRRCRKQKEQVEEDKMKTAISIEVQPETKPGAKPDASKKVEKKNPEASKKVERKEPKKSKSNSVKRASERNTEDGLKDVMEKQSNQFVPDKDMLEKKGIYKMAMGILVENALNKMYRLENPTQKSTNPTQESNKTEESKKTQESIKTEQTQ